MHVDQMLQLLARDIYLRKIDGMVYGDSPRQGFVRGRRFSHPELGFTFEVPEGFTLQNTAKRVMAQGPDVKLPSRPSIANGSIRRATPRAPTFSPPPKRVTPPMDPPW